MNAIDESSIPAEQPDLEEFLSALDGFLSKQAAHDDPRHIRFLEIFFRIVKSDKGHLLKASELGSLHSVVSYGIGSSFDEEFNREHDRFFQEPSPLDMAFRDKDAVAIVELAKEPDVPRWFMDLMKKHGFVSLVAVPLMGVRAPVGILCAYYRDVCLFDRATLGHLMMIGRMVGQATEKSQVADRAEIHGERDKSADQLLRILLGKPFTKLQVYTLLSKIASEALDLSGLVVGPVTKTSRGQILTVAAGTGLPSESASTQVALPPFIASKFSFNQDKISNAPRTQNEWGELRTFIDGPISTDLCRPIIWHNQTEGAVIGWRVGNQLFDADDDLLIKRLVSIAALALHTI